MSETTLFGIESLTLAWHRYVWSTKREAKDYFGIKALGTNLEDNLQRLSMSLLAGEWKPSRPPKFFKPKPSGTYRTVTVLPIEDALVFQAIGDFVAYRVFDSLYQNSEFVFGSVLHPSVAKWTDLIEREDSEYYLFQPYQFLYQQFADSVNTALSQLGESGPVFCFETDITGFFDSIPHYNLLEVLQDESDLSDRTADLLGECLNVWSGTRDRPTPGVGIPQSVPTSSLLANLLLHELDNAIKMDGMSYYRYMDDIRIYSNDRVRLEAALGKMDRYLKGHGLSINTKKTRIQEVDSSQEHQIIFVALGYAEIETVDVGELRFLQMAEQDQGEDTLVKITLETQEDKDVFAELELDRIETLLTQLVSRDTEALSEVTEDSRVRDRLLTSLAYRFRQANRIGSRSDLPDRIAILLLDAFDEYFWRADQLCWALQCYRRNDLVKSGLLDKTKKYSHVEWIRSQCYSALAYSQTFRLSELQILVRELDVCESWFDRLALYKLIFAQSGNRQLRESVLARAGREEDTNLKRQILFLDNLKEDEIQTLITSSSDEF